ncbi:MAG: chorismate mutase [Oscillospiraceae bacterium]|nr:chorismate mutase [Oscillospiraceae bacterium]
MELKDYRVQLDSIDEQMITLFKARMETVEQIAAYKKAHHLPILAAGREQEIVERVRARAGETLAPYAQELFETLMRLSREYQNTLLNDSEII